MNAFVPVIPDPRPAGIAIGVVGVGGGLPGVPWEMKATAVTSASSRKC